jgi:chemotaxis signal transduction protein
MRGQIVTLFNLATILGLADNGERGGRVTCIILKQSAGSANQCGFVIDEPGDVLDLEDALVEDPPSQLLTDQSDHIAKVARLPDELLLIIQPQSVFDFQDKTNKNGSKI